MYSDSLRMSYLPPASVFFFTATATTEIYTLSLHDALPIFPAAAAVVVGEQGEDRADRPVVDAPDRLRSEEHTSELQSRRDLVCRLLLEKKNVLADLVSKNENDVSFWLVFNDSAFDVFL